MGEENHITREEFESFKRGMHKRITEVEETLLREQKAGFASLATQLNLEKALVEKEMGHNKWKFMAFGGVFGGAVSYLYSRQFELYGLVSSLPGRVERIEQTLADLTCHVSGVLGC